MLAAVSQDENGQYYKWVPLQVVVSCLSIFSYFSIRPLTPICTPVINQFHLNVHSTTPPKSLKLKVVLQAASEFKMADSDFFSRMNFFSCSFFMFLCFLLEQENDWVHHSPCPLQTVKVCVQMSFALELQVYPFKWEVISTKKSNFSN